MVRKNIAYKKSPYVYKKELCRYNGISEDFYSTSLPVEICEEQTNLQEKNGVLMQSQGIAEFDMSKYIDFWFFPAFNQMAVHYKKGEETLSPTMILTLNEKLIMYKPNSTGQVSFTVKIGSTAKSYATYEEEGVSYVIFPGKKNDLLSFDGDNYVEHPIGHNFHHICNHYMRLFASEKDSNVLYFSDDFAPYNWNISIDEGGYIAMPPELGAITQIISFGETLIVVQERGLSKVNAIGDQSEFSVKHINIENDILSNSVVDCMDRIAYCSSAGIGFFNGYESKIYFRELASKLKDRKVYGEYLEGKCYFSLMSEDEGYIKTEILVIDIASMKYHFMSNEHGNAIKMVRTKNKKYIFNYFTDQKLRDIRENGLFYLTEEKEPKEMVWRSGMLDFGKTGVDKLVRNIVFGGKTRIGLKVVCDGEKYTYNVDKERRVQVNLRGREFQFEIQPQGYEVALPPPIIEYQIVEEV